MIALPSNYRSQQARNMQVMSTCYEVKSRAPLVNQRRRS